MSHIARRFKFLVSRFDEIRVQAGACHHLIARSFSGRKHVVAGEGTPQGDSQMYDSNKMSKLFDDVRTVDTDDGVLSAELSGMASSVAGVCWHLGALSELVMPEGVDCHSNAGSRGHGDEEVHPSFVGDRAQDKEKQQMLDHVRLLMDNEKAERERIRALIAKQHRLGIGSSPKHVAVNRDISTMKLLTIASQISGRQPAQVKPQSDERKARREQAYYRNANKGRHAILQNTGNRQRHIGGSTELVRVLDVDALPLPMLHHMVCYTMVKHMPAETVLKVISRIAMLRDKDSHVAYQNFLRDISRIASPLCRAEIVALLSRCYQSISVPFMVDYVRRFGTFSRRFMAKLIQTHSQPLPLDFLRYRAGQRSINQLLTRPWALFGYVKMLKKSSAKTYMYHNLLARGYVPKEDEFERFHCFGTLDANMATTIINSEKMLNDSVEFDTEESRPDPHRPKIYEEVLEAQTLGIPLEEVHDETRFQEEAHEVAPSAIGTQMVKIQAELPMQKGASAEPGFRDVEEDLPADRRNISWTTPWGTRRDVFHFRGIVGIVILTSFAGKTYAMDAEQGWRIAKSPVRIHYLKNVQMNKRKRQRKALKLRASKLARRVLASRIDTVQN